MSTPLPYSYYKTERDARLAHIADQLWNVASKTPGLVATGLALTSKGSPAWIAVASYVESLMRMAAMDEAERIAALCRKDGCDECAALINEEGAPWNTP